MKNICYYEPSSGFGGSSSNLYHILRQLDKSRFKPLVIVHQDGDQFDRIRSLGIEVLKVSCPQLEAFYKAGHFQLLWMAVTVLNPLVVKIASLIRERNIDLVHINTNIALGIPMIMAARSEKKKIFCYIRESRPLIRRERHFVKKVDHFLILNREAMPIYGRDIPARKLHVLPDGVDLTEFEGLSSQRFVEDFQLQGRPVVGIVGRIVQGKGQLEFAQAAKIVSKDHPDARFVIVGAAKGDSSKYFDEVKSYVQREHLHSKVIFTGWRTDVKQIIHGLDILVLASTTFPEGLPNSIIEAMVLRKPAVATDIPGPPEIIEHGVTGFIVPPGDVEAMAQKISVLLSDTQLATAMGERGRQRAAELFDVRNVVQTLQDLYMAELNP